MISNFQYCFLINVILQILCVRTEEQMLSRIVAGFINIEIMVNQVVHSCSFTWLSQHPRKKQRWYPYSIRLLVSSSWPATSMTPTRKCKGTGTAFGTSTIRNLFPFPTFLGPLVTCIRQLYQHQKTYQTWFTRTFWTLCTLSNIN